MNTIQKIVLFFSIVALLTACDQEDEQIPAYLTIQDFTVVTNSDAPFNVGSLSHNITNARVFISDANNTGQISDDLGVISLPSTIPYLGTGEKIIRLQPMIKGNGSSFTLRTYPYYKEFSQTITFNELEETVIAPVVEYLDFVDLEVEFNEEFEGDNSIFRLHPSGVEGNLVNDDTDVFEGNKSGKIVLDPSNQIIELMTLETYTTASSAMPFIELNYKTEVPILVGVIGIRGSETSNLFEFGIVESEEWNKIYLEPSEQINFLESNGFNEFKVGFRAALPVENGNFINETRTIYFDNFKLLSFKI